MNIRKCNIQIPLKIYMRQTLTMKAYFLQDYLRTGSKSVAEVPGRVTFKEE